MLNAREPKIVNGPQILDKYVGESEANVRKLFADAEEEEKRVIIHCFLIISYFSLIKFVKQSNPRNPNSVGAKNNSDYAIIRITRSLRGVYF